MLQNPKSNLTTKIPNLLAISLTCFQKIPIKFYTFSKISNLFTIQISLPKSNIQEYLLFTIQISKYFEYPNFACNQKSKQILHLIISKNLKIYFVQCLPKISIDIPILLTIKYLNKYFIQQFPKILKHNSSNVNQKSKKHILHLIISKNLKIQFQCQLKIQNQYPNFIYNQKSKYICRLIICKNLSSNIFQPTLESRIKQNIVFKNLIIYCVQYSSTNFQIQKLPTTKTRAIWDIHTYILILLTIKQKIILDFNKPACRPQQRGNLLRVMAPVPLKTFSLTHS
eukprot:TRINITY_DN9374_c0_g1_i2.p1 TRINITY_DN9374_c0_g1~~TRINITY_DN9374_c0_g1_i2.p1  ORF type:complete len:313 (-),score=-34.42 TRINITY_DN9374_c0_g1_i2:345-1193(-)